MKKSKISIVVIALFIVAIGTLSVYNKEILKIEKKAEKIQAIEELPKEFTQIAIGQFNCYAIDTNQNLWGWGANANGQLGNGTNTTVSGMIKIKSGTKFTKIVTCNDRCLAIDTNQNLWSWGKNDSEVPLFANSSTSDVYTPIQIKAGTKFKDIACGYSSSMAIDTSGNLWAWGYNNNGILGTGNKTNQTTPVKVGTGKTFTKVSMYDHTLAIDTSGNLWAWGLNEKGALGIGNTTDQSSPVQVKSGTKFNEIVAAPNYSLAIDTSGNLWAWGSNASKNIGNGASSSNIPVQIKSGTTFKKVSAYDNVLAIDTSGNLWGWGQNANGELGNGTTSSVTTPTQLNVGKKYSNVAVGIIRTLVIDENNTMWGSGSTAYDGINTTKKFTPIPRIEYNVTLNTNGGTVQYGNITKYIWKIGATLPTEVTRTGYVFEGWYDNSSFTGNPITNISDTEIGDKTYYAKWTEGEGVEYRVFHWKQMLPPKEAEYGSGSYEVKKGRLGETVTAEPVSFEGFHENTQYSERKASGVVEPNGKLELHLYYDRDIYNITLNTNGGKINSGDVKQYMYGTITRLPTNVTKTGYTFGGWYDNTSFTGEPITLLNNLATGNKTYYAKWTQNEYTVTFLSDGQTLKTEKVLEGRSATAPATPTKVGYTFAGWDKSFTNVTSNLTVNAKWTQNKYTVTFKNGDTVLNTQEVAHGGSATAPATPTKVGYTFAGWDKSFTNVTSNLTVNAKWTQNKYTVTFKNGDTVLNTQEVAHGGSATAPETPEKVGHTFIGWNKPFTNVTSNLEVSAQWRANTYNVTLNTNEGTIPEEENVTSYTYGIGATLPTPVRQGYTFAGWYINEDLTGESIHTIGALATGDKTYFAKWKAGEGTAYTVEYYKENLQGTYDRVEADTQHLTGTTGQSVTVTPKTYEGFTAKEDNILTGTIAADGSLVIKVYYDRNTYTITYEPNYSTPGGVVNPETVMREFKYGESVQIDNIHVTRTGYNFIGWNTETIGNGTNYQVGDTYSKNESTTLYAQWRANTYNVTLNTNEGTIPEEEDVTSYTYGVGATLPTPVRQGYTFAGWYTNAELEGNNVVQITETDIGDKEYFAKWEEGTGTAYKVEHYKQNLTTNTYEKVATDDLTAKTGLTVTATPKTYEGYHENQSHENRVASGVVSADGSLVLKLYYDINQYTVIFKDGNQVVKEETVAHGGAATAPTITKDKYVLRWDKTYNNVTSDLTVNANWLKDTDGDGIPDIEDNDTQVAYKVKHYKQVGNTNEYRLEETEELTGHLGSQVTAVAKSYEGYVENISVKERIPSGEVVEDGSLELRLFYDTIKYTVTFVSDGQMLSTQNIAHGQAAVAPETPTKEGYTFAGWDKDFTNVTSNLEVKAIWTKNQDEPKQVGYKVEHYKQNTKTNTYEKVATEELTGTTGSTVTAVAKTYEGFHENTIHGDRVASGVVSADGSLVLKLYYDINKYTVTFKDGDQVVKTETVEHGGNATPPTITKPGYILSWDKGTDNVTGDTTFTAVWTKDPNYVDPNANKNDGKEEKPSFLPQTGESYIVVGMISLAMSVAVLVYLKYRKISK